MSGPWERYAQGPPSSGPWERYAPPPASPVQGPPTYDEAMRSTINQGNRFANEVAAVGRGALDTATFGFSDELAAAGAALNPISALIDWATGSNRTMADRYDQSLRQSRAAANADEQDRWGARLVGQVAGGFAIPVAAGAQSVGSLARTGAAMGGLYGVGSGEGVQDRAAQGVTGAAIGGAVGAALPKVLEAGAAVIDGSQRLGQAVGGFMRAAGRPEAEAERRVGNALQRDFAARGVTPAQQAQDMAGLQAQGAPIAIMDMGGNATQRLARGSANRSPEASNLLQDAVETRFITQSDRVLDAVRQAAPGSSIAQGGNPTSHLDALRAAAERSNRANYARAYGAPNAQGMWDSTLESFVQADAVQSAIREVARTGRNYAVALGHTPVRNPFVTDAGNVTLRDPNVRPTLQFWDYVKRNLDDQADAAFRAGRNDEARIIGSIRNQLRSHLDSVVPEYSAARAGAARLFNAEDAYEAGQNMVMSRMQNADFRARFAKMNPEEQALFRDGFVERIRTAIQEVPDQRDLMLRNMFASPAAKERIEIALGPQGAVRLDIAARAEGIMQASNRAVRGNSTTAQQLEDLASGARRMPGFSPREWLSEISLAVRGPVNERLALETARLLTSSNPADIQKLINAASSQPRLRDLVQRIDGRVSALSGQGVALSEIGPSVSRSIQTGAARVGADEQQSP